MHLSLWSETTLQLPEHITLATCMVCAQKGHRI